MAVSLSPPFLANAEPEFRALPAANPNLRASIIVPARDEAAHITGALDALARQRAGDGNFLDPSTFEILLLCNNCRDETAAIARAWARAHPHIALHIVEKTLLGAQACIGAARKMLMDAAYIRLQQAATHAQATQTASASQAQVLTTMAAQTQTLETAATATQTAMAGVVLVRAICSTDADSRVDEFWLTAIWAELENGAHAVGGRILVERATNEQPAVRRLYLEDTTYRLLSARLEARLAPNDFDPWPRHFQFFGASLAVRPQAYAHVGGLPRTDCLEDVALQRALVRGDVPLRHSPWVGAFTSARRAGRVGCGLSTQLAQWEALDAGAWTVATGAELVQRYQLRRRAHGLFCAPALADCDDYASLAAQLFLPAARVQNAFENAVQFGALWDDLWQAAEATDGWKERWPHVAIRVAIAQLRELLRRGSEK